MTVSQLFVHVSVFASDLSQLIAKFCKVTLCCLTLLHQHSQVLNFFVLVLDNVVQSFDLLCYHFHLVLVFVNSLVEFSQLSAHGFVILTQFVHLLTFSVESLDFICHLGHSRFVSENLFSHFFHVFHSVFKTRSLSPEVLILVFQLLDSLFLFT